MRVPKWSVVPLGLALLWLVIAGVLHLFDSKDGLGAYMSDRGCYGGAGGNAPSESQCNRAEWFYENWWALPSGAVILSGLLVVGFAWASTPGKDIEWPDAKYRP